MSNPSESSHARGQALAEAFTAANNQVITLVEGVSDEQWRNICEGETWSVGVTARHIAASHAGIAGFVRAVAEGQGPPPLDPAAIHQGNAEHAHAHANCTRAEVLDLLRTGGAEGAATLRGLTDAQLANSTPIAFAGGQPWTAAEIAERIMIGHMQMHLPSIQAAIGR